MRFGPPNKSPKSAIGLLSAFLVLVLFAGTGKAAPPIRKIISVSGNLSFGNVRVGTFSQALMTISNSATSGGALTVTNITLPTGFSTTFGGTSIRPGNSTTAIIQFSPTAVQSYSGFAQVNSDANSGNGILAVSGTGIGQAITVTGDLSFGNVAVNTTAQQTLTISNSGTTNLTVTGIAYPAGFSGGFSGVIAPGTSTNVTVTFSPTALTNYGGNVTVDSDALSGTSTIAASGTGAASMIVLSGNLNFGNVQINASAQQTLVISNSGNVTLNVSGISYPAGFSGDFSGAIVGGTSTNVTVTFSPTAVTNYGGTVTVTSDAFAGANTIVASGSGVAGTITLGGNLSFGTVPVNTSAQLTLVVSNSGNGTLNVSSITYPAEFSGAFAGAIAPGASTNVSVTFSPTSTNSYGGTVTVNSDAVGGVNTIPASGTGIASAIALSGDLNFGGVTVGSSAQLTLTITNTGGVTLNVSSITYPTGFSGAFAGAIAPGATTNVSVTFSPTNATSYSGTVTVNSDAFNGVNTVTASGTGNAQTQIISLSGDLNFGSVFVGNSSSLPLTISNSGNSDLTFTNIEVPAGYTVDISSGVLAPETSTNVTVTFSPPDTNAFDGTLTVDSDATGGTNTVNVTGSGTAVPTRVISLSGDLNYGNVIVGSQGQQTLTITNSGNATMTVSNINYPAGFSGSFSGAIAPGSTTNVMVTFMPTVPGAYGGIVTVNSDATDGTNIVNASGEGIAATAIVSLSGDLNFGNVTVDTSAQLTMTITNNGNSDLTFTNVETPAGFSVNVTNGVIAPGMTTNVMVTFSPTAAVDYSGAVVVDSDETSGTNSVTATGTGVVVIVPTRIIILSGNMNFGDVPVGATPQLTLTISNAGNSTLNISNITVPQGFLPGPTIGVIEAGASFDLKVTFSPTTNQPYSGTITVVSDATLGTNTVTASGDAYHYVAAKPRMNGLFYPSNSITFSNSGYFSGRASTRSVFSGRYRLGGKQYSISGTFSGTGSFSGNIARTGLSSLAVTLQAGFDGGNVWKGIISDGTFVAMMHAENAVYNSRTNAAPQAGTYNITITGSTNAVMAPSTNGTGTVTVMTSGAAMVRATLGDGTRMSQTTFVGKDSMLPFFGSLYGGKGSILGWLTVGNAGQLNGNVDWFSPVKLNRHYPDGFAFGTTLTGAKQ